MVWGNLIGSWDGRLLIPKAWSLNEAIDDKVNKIYYSINYGHHKVKMEKLYPLEKTKRPLGGL